MEVFLVFIATVITLGLIWLYIKWDSKRTIEHRKKVREREEQLRQELLRSWEKNKEELRVTMKPKVQITPIPVPPSKSHYGKPAPSRQRHDETHHHHYHQDTSSPLADVVGMAVVAELVEDLVEDRVEQAAQEVFQPAVGSFGGGGSSGSWEEPVRSSYSEPSYSSGSDSGSSSSYDSGSSSSSSSSSDY